MSNQDPTPTPTDPRWFRVLTWAVAFYGWLLLASGLTGGDPFLTLPVLWRGPLAAPEPAHYLARTGVFLLFGVLVPGLVVVARCLFLARRGLRGRWVAVLAALPLLMVGILASLQSVVVPRERQRQLMRLVTIMQPTVDELEAVAARGQVPETLDLTELTKRLYVVDWTWQQSQVAYQPPYRLRRYERGVVAVGLSGRVVSARLDNGSLVPTEPLTAQLEQRAGLGALQGEVPGYAGPWRLVVGRSQAEALWYEPGQPATKGLPPGWRATGGGVTMPDTEAFFTPRYELQERQTVGPDGHIDRNPSSVP